MAEDIESRLKELLATAPAGYEAVYMFGSQARGTAGPKSDVDLAFWQSKPSGADLADQPFDYAAELSLALGKEVELVELNRAPPDLVHRVMRDGKLLLERDRSARIAREVRARREYLDLLPVLRRYRKARSER
jgi:predicted nucleotidyltransferase